MKAIIKENLNHKRCIGSALILAVVLSTLLALVGVLFVMAAHINQMGTSAISENKELEYAVDTVISELSLELVKDSIVDINSPNEIYDYPDANNAWLASLEPYESGGDYYWRQVSDITGYITGNNRDVKIEYLSQYAPIPDTNNPLADADGDGVADSQWFKLSGISSSRSRPIYAAVRVIDNGGMLNVNTGFKFDPNELISAISDVDGKNQTQINVLALASDLWIKPDQIYEENLLLERENEGSVANPANLQAYLYNYIWNFGEPKDFYTPFDLSDELELRYRYLLNNTDIDTRLEEWSGQMRSATLSTPVDDSNSFDKWFDNSVYDGIADLNYSYRHIATTCNMDRILNPEGKNFNNGKMVNINAAPPQLLFDAIRLSLQGREPNALRLEQLAAQLAVNIVDLRDGDDTDVTILPVGTNTYYGFEAQPFISDIGFKISNTDPEDSEENSFAIELYNPFSVEIPLGNFKIELYDSNDSVEDSINMNGYIIKPQGRFVITNNSDATSEFDLNSLMSSGSVKQDPNLVLADYVLIGGDPPTYMVNKRYNIRLVRRVSNVNLLLDQQTTEEDWFTWDDANDSSEFYCRSDSNWNIVYQEFISSSTNTLGKNNSIAGTRKNYNLANTKDYFVTIGDISRVLTLGPGIDSNDTLGAILASEPNEYDIRLDLTNPVYANMFQFLTAIDPTEYGMDPNETRIKGRININTAPWFVLAQLPWMNPDIAYAIASFRDKLNPMDPLNRPFEAFDTIGDLMQVPEMGYFAMDDSNDLAEWPDFTPSDGADNDFEERDIIFSRISNLITTRSDVFTAYILVRIGRDGPQKRMLAILDRSKVKTYNDRVKILALQPVPDPR